MLVVHKLCEEFILHLMAMSLSLKILWSFVRLDRPWFIRHSPMGAKNSKWNSAPPETSNSDILHHTQRLARPCEHRGPRAFLLGVDVSQGKSVKQRK